MKKQVIVIHGGDAYNSYEEFLHDLKGDSVEKEDFMQKTSEGWKDKLGKKLGNGYEIFAPEMPNWMNAKYSEWQIWFEKMLPYIDEGPVFIGHSLGGIFLARYFAENPDKKKARAVILIAPPYRDQASKESLADFVLPADYSRLNELGSRLHVWFSEDDPIVFFANLAKYKKVAPGATFKVFKNYGHFLLKDFPEIIKEIKAAFKK